MCATCLMPATFVLRTCNVGAYSPTCVFYAHNTGTRSRQRTEDRTRDRPSLFTPHTQSSLFTPRTQSSLFTPQSAPQGKQEGEQERCKAQVTASTCNAKGTAGTYECCTSTVVIRSPSCSWRRSRVPLWELPSSSWQSTKR